jgi:pimeloyl-ACP methyl ester carboxylesterase
MMDKTKINSLRATRLKCFEPKLARETSKLTHSANSLKVGTRILSRGDEMFDRKNLQTGMAQIKGAKLYYEIAGKGPALVLIHAGFVDHRMWNDQFEVFARQYRVVRYDMRGFGQSEKPVGSFSHRQDLYELLEFLTLKEAHMLGCSVGGGVVIDFALEHPEMTKSLVLVSSAVSGYQIQGDMPKPLKDLSAALKEKDLQRAADLAVQIWIDGPRRTPEQVDIQVRERTHEMSLTALPNVGVKEIPLEPPALEQVHKLAVATLVLVGELDDDSIKTIGELLSTSIRDSRKEIISEAAHLPNMEKPEEFNRMVLEFLNRLKK